MYQLYIQGLLSIAGCIAATAVSAAFVTVVTFYSYRAVRWVIKNHTRNINRIKKSKAFDFQKTNVTMIPEKGKKAQGGKG